MAATFDRAAGLPARRRQPCRRRAERTPASVYNGGEEGTQLNVGRLTAQDVAQLAQEIHGSLAGSWVQAVYQPDPLLVLLHLYGQGGRQRLLLDLHPERLCVALLPGGGPPNPPQPPPFCMLLRKHLEGTRLAAAAAHEGDRILYLAFYRPEHGPTSLPGPRPWALDESRLHGAVLVAELTGRSANLFLEVGGQLVGWMRPPGPARELKPGRPYQPPPAMGAPQPSEPSLAPGVPHRPLQVARGLRLLPALGEQWLQHFTRHRLEAERRELLKRLQRAERRLARRLERQQQDLQAAGDPQRWRRMGELLLAYAGRVPPGAGEVLLPPQEECAPGEAPLAIPLDRRLNPAQNAEACFQRYRKAQRARQIQQAAMERTQAALFAVQLALALARAAETPEDLKIIGEEAREALQAAGAAPELAESAAATSESPGRRPSSRARGGPQARARRSAYRSSGIARFLSSDGFEVLAGRSAVANDRLTTTVARPDDLWLHARHLPGAHVVVRCGGRPVPPRTLEEAAGLAARLSAAGSAATPVEVDVTFRRHVRKPPGAPAGFVSYTHERTLRVHPDAAAALKPWPAAGAPASDERPSVAEVPDACEDHGDAGSVCGRDGFVVPDGAARLDDGGDTVLRR